MKSEYYIFGKIIVSKRKIKLNDIESVCLIRLNISSLYLDGPSIRKTLNIHNKYVIYIIRKDNSYDWIIGFNNYVESKRTINMLYSILKCKILDATENEYRDEDEYISSYIRFKR